MKAVLLALFFGLLLLVAVSVGLNRALTESRVSLLLGTFATLLAVLVPVHLWTPADLGFLPPALVAPIWWVDLGFAVFLFAVGFFGGVAQLYNLAERGLSLRILIDILESKSGSMTPHDIVASYGAGRGMVWMYDKRLAGLVTAGLVRVADEDIVLTAKGRRIASVFDWLHVVTRVHPSKGAKS